MRAKNEFRNIAGTYDTKLILERVVDGKLMCPEACCGAPVVECTCGEDCPHCNCFMIHKAMKSNGLTDKLLKEFYKMRDPDGDGSWPDDDDDRSEDPNYGEPKEDDEYDQERKDNIDYAKSKRYKSEDEEQAHKESYTNNYLSEQKSSDKRNIKPRTENESFKERYKPKTHWQLEELRRYGL